MSGSMRYRDGAWRLTVQADRRRHYATIHAPNNRTGRNTASRALAALVTEVDQGQHLGDHTTTVAQLLDAWLAHHGPSLEAGTAAGYRQTVAKHLRPALGDVPLLKLRPHRLDLLYADLKRAGLAPKTIRNIAGTIHAALNQAVRWGWIARNPADSATPPQAKRKQVTVPTATQVTAVIDHARPDFAALVRLAATTGHRRGNLIALRWTDVDLDHGQITFARAIAVADDAIPGADGDTFISVAPISTAPSAVAKGEHLALTGRVSWSTGGIGPLTEASNSIRGHLDVPRGLPWRGGREPPLQGLVSQIGPRDWTPGPAHRLREVEAANYSGVTPGTGSTNDRQGQMLTPAQFMTYHQSQ